MSCVRIKGPGRTSGILCIIDYPRPEPDSTCPNAAAHEPFPHGYVAASEHAEQLMEAGYTQEAPCPGCGKWAIWTPPPSGTTPADNGEAT